MASVREVVCAFIDGWQSGRRHDHHHEKELRENLSEKQIDKMVKDSFPASDPPSTY
jgi:hypothetical protein